MFDIDADHIPTPCDKVHDSWVCSNCGFSVKGPSPERCLACGKAKFDKIFVRLILGRASFNSLSMIVIVLKSFVQNMFARA